MTDTKEIEIAKVGEFRFAKAGEFTVKSAPAIICNNGIKIDFSGIVGESGNINISPIYRILSRAISMLELIAIEPPTTEYIAKVKK